MHSHKENKSSGEKIKWMDFLWYNNFGSRLFLFCHKAHIWKTDRQTDRKATTIRCVCIRSHMAKNITSSDGEQHTGTEL